MHRPLRFALLTALLLAPAAAAQTDADHAAARDSLAREAAQVAAALLVDARAHAAGHSDALSDLTAQARAVSDRRDLRRLRTAADALRFDVDRDHGRLLATLDQVIETLDAALAGDAAPRRDAYVWTDDRDDRDAEPLDPDYEWTDAEEDDGDWEADLDWGGSYEWDWTGPRRTYGSDLHDDLFWREPITERGLPVRYNRVEGLYVGLRTGDLDLDRRRPARGVGGIGYAFGLGRLRYHIGAESRVTPRGPYAALVGVRYGREQATYDRWKADPVENALAAFAARNDFYDYFESEGWSVYARQRVASLGHVAVAYRSDQWRALEREVSWSLFGGNPFRFNPLFDQGRADRIVASAVLGRVRGIETLPSGAAVQAEAELGDGLGGDFAYTRLTGDGRLYLHPDPSLSIALRLRATHVTGSRVPLQALPTVGGVGSVRAFPQNAFAGRTAVVANAEIATAHFQLFDDVADDLFVLAFADAAHTDDASGGLLPATRDWIGSAGFGLGLDERAIRLELAWPLRDAGYGTNPTLWLRVLPTF